MSFFFFFCPYVFVLSSILALKMFSEFLLTGALSLLPAEFSPEAVPPPSYMPGTMLGFLVHSWCSRSTDYGKILRQGEEGGEGC